MGALRTALSCCLLDLVSVVLYAFIYFLLVKVSIAFSLAFQLSPCVYVLGKNECLVLMRGG